MIRTGGEVIALSRGDNTLLPAFVGFLLYVSRYILLLPSKEEASQQEKSKLQVRFLFSPLADALRRRRFTIIHRCTFSRQTTQLCNCMQVYFCIVLFFSNLGLPAVCQVKKQLLQRNIFPPKFMTLLNVQKICQFFRFISITCKLKTLHFFPYALFNIQRFSQAILAVMAEVRKMS